MKITKSHLMEIINEELLRILNEAQALTAADLAQMRDEDEEDEGSEPTAQARKNIEDFVRAMQTTKKGNGDLKASDVLKVATPKSSVPSMSQLMSPGGDTQSMAPAGATRAMPMGVPGDEGGYEEIAKQVLKQAGQSATPERMRAIVNALKQTDVDRERPQKPSLKQKILKMFKEEYAAYLAEKLHEAVGTHLTPVAQQLSAAGIAKQPESVRRDLMQLVIDLDFEDPTDIEELGMMVSQLIDAAGENIEGDYGLEEVYSDKQRRWACAQADASSDKRKKGLSKKEADEMCKGPTLKPKSKRK